MHIGTRLHTMNYSLEEQVAQWRVDEAETLDNYAQCDWTPPEDVLGAYVTMILFKDSDVDLLQASRYAVETQSARAQMWVKEQAEWEKKYDPLCTQDLRTRFLGECLRKGVNTEWLVDAKQRWEVQAFSSISPKFLTIGDVSVEYSGMNLSLKKEVDLELPVSQPGRESLTTFRWREGGMMKGVQAARPKINGERFVSVRTDKSTLLQGFVTYKLPLHFIPDTVEYYAGKFYVIAPITEKVLEYEARDLDGRVLMLSFLPHPWNTPDQVAFLPDLYTHKYDGVMVAFQGQEYRVKFDPTIEVELDKEIWEVREYDGKLHRVRNRFGKTPVSLMSALGRMRTSVLAGELVKLFVHVSGELPEMFKASSSLNQNASAKVLFLTPDGRLVFFRDKRIARLDFGGGMLKDGESPVDAAIREISEEFVEPSGNLMLAPSDLYYLGMSREEGDTVVWTTHLFVARAPENVGRYEGVELYSVHSFRDFKHSPNGRPRQVWLAHYLQWLSENLETVAQLQIFLSMLSGVPPQAAPNKWVRTRCLDAYVERIVKIFFEEGLVF